MIIITANGTTVIEKWPTVWEDLKETSSKMEALTLRDDAGKLLLIQPWDAEYNGHLSVWTSRAQL